MPTHLEWGLTGRLSCSATHLVYRLHLSPLSYIELTWNYIQIHVPWPEKTALPQSLDSWSLFFRIPSSPACFCLVLQVFTRKIKRQIHTLMWRLQDQAFWKGDILINSVCLWWWHSRWTGTRCPWLVKNIDYKQCLGSAQAVISTVLQVPILETVPLLTTPC